MSFLLDNVHPPGFFPRLINFLSYRTVIEPRKTPMNRLTASYRALMSAPGMISVD